MKSFIQVWKSWRIVSTLSAIVMLQKGEWWNVCWSATPKILASKEGKEQNLFFSVLKVWLEGLDVKAAIAKFV